MDNPEFAAANNPPRQKDKKENSGKLEKTIYEFTQLQIALASLLLVPVIFDVTTHEMVFSTIAAIFLVPPFIISVIIEVVTILVIKVVDKNNVNKAQDYSSANAVHNIEITDPEQQIKRAKTMRKGFVILFSLLAIIIILSIGNYFLPKYSVISEEFSREEKALNNSQYRTTIIKNAPLDGIMTIQLDDDVTFDYVCEVHPFGLDSGYGPFCSYEFPNGSHSMGEYIFQKNYKYIQKLLIKYQDILIVDNAKHIFIVKNQKKMELFFSELMQNADFNKAFKVYNNSNDANFSNSLDYILIREVEYEGKLYGGIGLFTWANYMGFGS